VKRYQDDIKEAFINGNFEGMGLDSGSKNSINEQLADSFKTVDEWREYFSRLSIEIKIAEPSSSSGRYDLYYASKNIAQAINESRRTILNLLTHAVLAGSLPVYPPGSQVKYKPKQVTDHYEEVCWDDLNTWLETSTREINWRFPDPSSSARNILNNDINAAPFSNPPARRDEWFYIIEETMWRYMKNNGSFPSAIKAWVSLWENPPQGYGISTGTDRGEDALLMGEEILSKSAFKKRFQRWQKKAK